MLESLNTSENKDIMKNKRIYVMLFLCGFFGLSNNVTNLIFSKIGISFYLFEIFLIPLLVQRKLKEYLNIGYTMSFVLLMLCAIFGILAGIVNTGNPGAVITCARSMMYLMLVAYMLPKLLPNEGDLDNLFVISFGALMGDISFLFTNQSVLLETGYIHINILAVAFSTTIPFITRKISHIVLGLSGATIAAFFSGYRINTLVLFIAILVGGLYYIRNSKIIKRILLLIIYILVASSILVNYVQLITNVSQFLNLPKSVVYRIVERTEDLETGNLSRSDMGRISQYKKDFKPLAKQVLPQGTIRKAISMNEYGKYTDVPVTYLVDMFGSIVTIIMVIYLLIKWLWLFVRVFMEKNMSEMKIFAGMCFPIILCLFLINGTMFSFANIAVMAGIPIGYVINK